MKAFLTRPTYKTKMISQRLADAGIECDFRAVDQVCPRDLLIEKIAEVDALLTHTEDIIDEEILRFASPKLKIIANMGIGFSNIDVEFSRSKGIVVTNTPVEEAFEATAEATVAILLAVARRIPTLHHQRMLTAKDINPSFLGPTAIAVRNKTLGIIGFGRIGSRVGKIMHQGFNNRIVYFDVFNHSELEKSLGAKRVELSELLTNSDFVCVTMPLSESSKGLISRKQIQQLKTHAVFINTARAEVIDEQALIERLNKGELHGVGLDVYTDAVDTISADNIALTSHMANFEDEAYTAMSTQVAMNVIGMLTRGKAISAINQG